MSKNKLFKTAGICAVFGVSNYQAALEWYAKWLGEPDELPCEGMAEWLIADNAWLQVDASRPPSSDAAVISVDDIAAARKALLDIGIAVEEIANWDVVLSCSFPDPDGNHITLVQML